MISRLARRYARALLSLARDASTAPQTAEELAVADTAFQDERLTLLLSSPLVDAAKRVAIARDVTGALGLSPLVRNVVLLLAERDRLSILPDVHRSYGAMLDDLLGRTRARIRSAVELTDPQQQELTALATRLAAGRKVIMTAEVDPSLLGGIVLDVGGTVYDGSLHTQLQRISKNMSDDAR